MKIFYGVLLFALVMVSGCRSNKSAPPVEPQKDGKFKLTLNVEEAAPAESTANKVQADVKNKKVPVKRSGQAVKASVPPATAVSSQKTLEPSSAAKSHVLVPDPSGVIDSDLNSVEQSYVKQLRERHKETVRANEEKIFGSFNPQKLFTSPAKKK